MKITKTNTKTNVSKKITKNIDKVDKLSTKKKITKVKKRSFLSSLLRIFS